MSWVVGHIMLVIPVLGGKISAHSWNDYDLSCLEIISGLGENGWKY